MARRGRAAASKAAAAIKNTPQTYEPEDETMQDAPESDAGTPQNDEEEDEDVQGDENEDAASAPEDGESAPQTPQPDSRPTKRRLGRPPKLKPPGWDAADDDEGTSERGTPNKRGRRGGAVGRGGGRWARKGGPSHVTQQPIDKEGNMMDVVNDELELPEDAEGETKVDKTGHLQGGREYRCRTFEVKGRGERLYMLSTEPARCVGFRDSYLFFAKHKKLFKIIIDDEEKRDMIARQLIPHSYKGRAIGVVTARSVFREFGAQIVVGGKRIIDDYEVTKMRQDGAVEGELADPNDAIKTGQAYNKNQYVAWHGASAVYHTGQPTVPMADNKKRKTVVNDVNWQYEHAMSASRFNSRLAAMRRENLNGVYDIHTNTMQYPANMQPTHVRWEPVSATTSTLNGVATVSDPPSIFDSVKHIHAREFLILDTVYENPPYSHLGVPGADGQEDNSFNGLFAVSDEIKDLLPPECRTEFEKALEKEKEWKGKWSDEKGDLKRRDPIVDKGLLPLASISST